MADVGTKQGLHSSPVWIHSAVEGPRIDGIVGFAAEVEVTAEQITNVFGALDFATCVVIEFLASSSSSFAFGHGNFTRISITSGVVSTCVFGNQIEQQFTVEI